MNWAGFVTAQLHCDSKLRVMHGDVKIQTKRCAKTLNMHIQHSIPMAEITVIGHKGAPHLAPENSMESFETALKLGVGAIELDVRLTKDGEVVVIHDGGVERTMNGRGKVKDKTLEELRVLTLKNRERIPTLAEVLEKFAGKCKFMIDMKAEFVEISAYEIVRGKGLISDVLFASLDGTQLLDLKVRDKNARVAFSCKDKKINMLKIGKSLRAAAINPKARLVRQELVDKAHAEGLDVNVWTVNKPRQMKKFIAMGVDGIITDKPDVLIQILNG